MKSGFLNKALRVLLLTNGFVLIASAMLGPIYALFVQDIGGDLLDAGLTGSIFALAAGLTTLYSGRIVDKVKNPKWIVAFGYCCIAIGFFGYLFVHNIYTLFAMQIIIGFGEAIYSPSFDALYSKHLAKTKRGKCWGAWESLNYFSLAIGGAVGGLVSTFFGFKTLFVIMGCICVSSSLIVLFTARKEL